MTPEIIKLRNQVNLYSDIAKIDNNYKGLSTRLNNLYRNKLQLLNRRITIKKSAIQITGLKLCGV